MVSLAHHTDVTQWIIVSSFSPLRIVDRTNVSTYQPINDQSVLQKKWRSTPCKNRRGVASCVCEEHAAFRCSFFPFL